MGSGVEVSVGGGLVGEAVGRTVGDGTSVGNGEGVGVLEGVGVEVGMSVNVGEGSGVGVGGTAVAEEVDGGRVAVGAGVGPVAQPAHANSTHRPAPTALSRWIVICGNGPD